MTESSLIQELRSAGLRATSARRAVIHVLEKWRQHLSAEDIHRVLTERGVRVDLSSVYRTLTLLVNLGLVRPVAPADRHGHFEVEHEERVHFVCSRCGKVIEAQLPRRTGVERAVAALARDHRFELGRFTVEAVGECARCRRSGNGRDRRGRPGVSTSGKRGEGGSAR